MKQDGVFKQIGGSRRLSRWERERWRKHIMKSHKGGRKAPKAGAKGQGKHTLGNLPEIHDSRPLP